MALIPLLLVACGSQRQQSVDIQKTVAAAVRATQAAQQAEQSQPQDIAASAPSAARTPTPAPEPTYAPIPTPTERPVSENAPKGFLAVDEDSVQFLQWTDTGGGQITGRFQTVRLSDEEAYLVEPQSGRIGGTISGSDVSISFGGGDAYQGTLEGDTLTLVVPDPLGELATIEYRRATVGEYNLAARSFRESINEEAASAYATQAAVQATQAVFDAQATQTTARMNEWEAALEDANAALEEIVVTSRKSWFTEADDGELGIAVFAIRESLRYLKEDLRYDDCASFESTYDQMQQELSDLSALREELSASVADVRQAVRYLKEARDAMGQDASNAVIGETRDVMAEADRRIKLLNEKSTRAQEMADAIAHEADRLKCNS